MAGTLYAGGWPASQKWDSARWPNFTPAELACKCRNRFCGGEYFHDPEFLDALTALREAMAGPLIINSGHRCAKWNAHEGGAVGSHHLTIAADVRIDPHDRHKLRAEAERLGFNGIGLGLTFLHVDRRPRPAVWGYGPAAARAWRKPR